MAKARRVEITVTTGVTQSNQFGVGVVLMSFATRYCVSQQEEIDEVRLTIADFRPNQTGC
jgi:hypothetical protein